jgi:amino acid adenylation domain-containing protein/thioester reductase-like protein
MSSVLKALPIHELIALQAEKTPDQVAIVFQAQQLTYWQLNQKANQLAHYLKASGVQPETLVGLCVERSLDMFVALLGILKAGGAYIPLDPNYPTERLAFIMADAQVSVVVTQQHLQTIIPTAHTVCLDQDWPTIDQQPTHNPAAQSQLTHLVYVIYTSGSTGKPKGVQITHGALVNLLQSMQQEPGLTADDTLLAITTISFDLSVPDLYLPLITGARIRLIERALAADAVKLAKILSDPTVTFVQATPATWQLVLAAGWSGNPRLKVLCGGEALPRSLANQLLARCAALWHMYGPTETTVWSMVAKVQPGDRAIPLGHPLANTQIYLVNTQSRRQRDPIQLVTAGASGEIYLGGQGVARGYLNRPELTAEKFIPDPFSADPTARIYKTGDLARYLPDGNIEIIGRIDHQVKIRGHRIELGDIEATLSQHAAVQEAVVIAREDVAGDRRLVAYVVLHLQGEPLRSAPLRAWLKAQLPDYMVPALVVFMTALPLTPNGKVDRRALPLPILDEQEVVALPTTAIEKQLTEIWTEILGIAVGIDQDFFESGGNSLGAALLLARINASFPVELTLECLFKAPTIAGLASAIATVQSSGNTAAFKITPAELQADAVLDPAIHPIMMTPQAPQHILLTGATGFIGAFLVPELLRRYPQAHLYCLVRAAHQDAASERLRHSLERYELWQDDFGTRIIPVIGDLAQPLLGLSELQFCELADRLDVIYHSGALVNLVYPYSALRNANVLGTEAILRLATQVKTIPVHYISTIDVFHSTDYAGLPLLLESDNLANCEGYTEGYAQSKWVAEKLVMTARDRGLPVCIYRLGMITGHSQTGACQLDNLICRMIKGFIQLGNAPELDLDMLLAPVDYVVQAIGHLAQQPDSLGKTFHLVSPHVLSLKQMVADLRRLGCDLMPQPYKQWQAQLALSFDNALTPVAAMFMAQAGEVSAIAVSTMTSQAFDDRCTQLGLADTDIICPAIDADILQAYLAYFQRVGFLPKPSPVLHHICTTRLI